MLWSFVPPTCEDLASEVALSSKGNTYPSRHIRSKWSRNLLWLVNSASLICGINRGPNGRVSASAYCGCCFDLQWWRSRCSLLMRPKKVETAVQCSVYYMYVFVGFSCHGKSMIISIPTFEKYIYIYICSHPQTVSLYYDSSLCLDLRDASSRDWNPAVFTSFGYFTPEPSSFQRKWGNFFLLWTFFM